MEIISEDEMIVFSLFSYLNLEKLKVCSKQGNKKETLSEQWNNIISISCHFPPSSEQTTEESQAHIFGVNSPVILNRLLESGPWASHIRQTGEEKYDFCKLLIECQIQEISKS